MKRWLLATLIFVFALAAQAQYVTLSGTLQGSNGVAAQNYTISFTPNQWFYVSGQSITVSTTTNCATSVDGSVVGLPNPLQWAVGSPGFTGTLPAGNYYVEYTFIGTLSAETLPSPETVIQLTSTGEIQVNAPAQGVPSGAVGMRVYIGTAPGTETAQGTTVGNASFVQSTPLSTGVVPPAANNTICKQVANDAGWPTGTGYKVALADSSGNTVPGYPMLWQLLGPNTTINLSNGLPYYHGVVTFPSPILASPYNHNLQTISSPVDLQGYNLTGVNALTACVVNKTVYANCLSGVDIGAKINAALVLCGSDCTIYVAPGGYNFSTQIQLPLNVFGLYKLQLDSGASIHYTGTSDAIFTPIGVNGPGSSQLIIEGGQLTGTSAAASGIHLLPTNRVTIQYMLITGFTGGDGIRVEGTNGSNIHDNLISGNLNDIHLIPTLCNSTFPYTCSPSLGSGTGYTPNAIHVHDNSLVSAGQWAYFDDRFGVTAGLTGSLGNTLAWNVLEQNGTAGPTFGAVNIQHGKGMTIEGNYFESSPREIVVGEPGAGSTLNTSGTIITSNYFTTGPSTLYNIELEDALNTTISNNSELIGPGTGGTNCDVNAVASGEAGTFYGKNNFVQVPPFGNLLCITGTAATYFAGAGSYSSYNQNYNLKVVDQNFPITAAASDTVTSVNVTAGSVCDVSAGQNGSSPTATANAQAQIATGNVYVTAANGSFTLYHPTGMAGLLYNIKCSGPLN